VANYQWTGSQPTNTIPPPATSGSWDDAANWSPAGIPGGADSVAIGTGVLSPSTQTITGTGSAASLSTTGFTTLAGTFVVTGDLSAFAVRSGASLISELGSLNLNSGSLTVGGLLTAGTGVSVWTMARRSKQRTSLYKRQA
jgi:hypothetical protein